MAAAWAVTPGADEQALRVVWEIREATYRSLRRRSAGRGPRGPARVRHARRAGSVVPALERGDRPRIARSGGGAARRPWGSRPDDAESEDARGVARIRYGDVPAWLVADRLAAACVELVQTVDVRQLKACPLDQGGCGWLFLDRSRNGSRRWCTMDDCGAHAKARRLTERRRRAATGKTS